jgi:hypothetical protein
VENDLSVVLVKTGNVENIFKSVNIVSNRVSLHKFNASIALYGNE